MGQGTEYLFSGLEHSMSKQGGDVKKKEMTGFPMLYNVDKNCL